MKPALSALAIALFFLTSASASEQTAKCDENCQTQASSGKPGALLRAFDALSASDGHASEELAQSIGKSVRAGTQNFLQALKKNRSKVARLDSILTGLGDDFVDRFDLQKKELQARVQALSKVKDSSLEKVRKESVAVLKLAIEKLEKTEEKK